MRYSNITRLIFPLLIVMMVIRSVTTMSPYAIVAGLLVVFTSLPIHEFAHGYVAHKLGDSTAEREGRLTLNPLAHLDLMGTIMILFVGFGWAKPVPVNPRNFKNPKSGMAITAAAGPISNLIMAFLLMICLQAAAIALTINQSNVTEMLFMMVQTMVSINISLALFNLLPIHPLDGSRILSYFLPDRIVYKLEEHSQMIYLIMMAVVFFTDLVTVPLSYMNRFVFNFMVDITAFVPKIAGMVLGG